MCVLEHFSLIKFHIEWQNTPFQFQVHFLVDDNLAFQELLQELVFTIVRNVHLCSKTKAWL